MFIQQKDVLYHIAQTKIVQRDIKSCVDIKTIVNFKSIIEDNENENNISKDQTKQLKQVTEQRINSKQIYPESG